MGYIDKIKDRLRVRTVKRGSGSQVDDATQDLQLDSFLTYRRDADEKWQYKDGRIYLNDEDVEDLLDYEHRDVRLWCGVSEALTEYKNLVLQRGDYRRGKFLNRVDLIQDRVLYNMKRLYDEKMDGIYLSFGDGEMLFNNFNVRAFLAMYHMRPTKKARRFLLGLKAKLALILVNRNGTPQYERVHRVVESLYNEVLDALAVSPIEVRRLPSSYRHKSV